MVNPKPPLVAAVAAHRMAEQAAVLSAASIAPAPASAWARCARPVCRSGPCRHVKLQAPGTDTENHQYKQIGLVASAYREGVGPKKPVGARATRGARAGTRHTQGTHAPPHRHACVAADGKAGGDLTAERRIYRVNLLLTRTEPSG
jgi:hypothetical protein